MCLGHTCGTGKIHDLCTLERHLAASTLWWSSHGKIHRGWSQHRPFIRHAVTSSLEHSLSTGRHKIGVRILADVGGAFNVEQERSVVDSA